MLRACCHGLCPALAVAFLLQTLAAVAQSPRSSLGKFEQEINDAIAEASKLSATDSGKALAILRNTFDRLDNDTHLQLSRRTSLMRTVRDRMTELGNGVAPGDARRAREMAEAQEIQRTLVRIRMLEARCRGYCAPSRYRLLADELKAELKAKNPNHPGVDGTRRTLDARDKMPQRREVNKPVLTEKEQTILKALDRTIETEFKDTALQDAIAKLADEVNAEFVLDPESLRAVNAETGTRVSFIHRRGASARTVLRKILGDLDLTYVIKGEKIVVLSRAKAKETLVQRTYSIGDLVTGSNEFQIVKNVDSLIKLIQSTIEPDSWKESGGLGTITFHAPTMSLVVKQTAEVHGVMERKYK
jgi:hypothetical protein